MDFPPSLNFLSLRERLHDAWLLLWPLLFLKDEEGLGLSSDRGSVDDDDDDDEGEGEGDGLFLFFFLLESPLLLLASRWVEGTDVHFFLGGVGLLLTRLRLGATSLSKDEEVSSPPLFFVDAL